MIVWIYAAMAILAIALMLLPAKTLAEITSFFSFGSFGIRRIRRWNNTTDTLGNFFIIFSLALSLCAFLIPEYLAWYGMWYGFTLLCVVSKAAAIGINMPVWKYEIMLGMLLVLGICGFVSAYGLLNNQAGFIPMRYFLNDLQHDRLADAWYYITNPTFFYVALQSLLLFAPLLFLWQQFKYMRLEDKFKGANLFTFTCYILFLSALMLGLSYKGFDIINIAYQVQTSRIAA